MKLVPTSSKLLLETKRDIGLSTVFEYKPSFEEFPREDYLFCVLEIIGAKETIEDIKELLLHILKENYFSDPHKKPLASFESALSKANEELAKATEEGKIHWLGRLNAIVGVISGDEIHLSKTGGAEAFLLRGQKLVQITEDLNAPKSENVLHPLKTFVNIASGDLEEKDRLLFVTPSILANTSQDAMKVLLEDYPIPKIAVRLGEILKETKREIVGSVLILEILTEERLEKKAISYEPTEIWIGEEKPTYKIYLEKTGAFLAMIFKRTSDAGKATVPFFKSLVPYFKKFYSSSKKQASTLSQKTADLVEKAGIKEKTKELADKITAPKEEKPSLEATKESLGVEIRSSTNLRGKIKTPSVFKEGSQKLFSFLGALGKRFKFGKKPYIPIILGIILILLGISLFFRYQGLKTKNYQNMLTQAQDKEKAAGAALIYEDKTKARNLLKEALDLLSKLKKANFEKEKVAALESSINQELDKAEGVVRITQAPIADLGSIKGASPKDIFLTGNILLSFDTNHNSLYQINLDSKEVSTAIASPAPTRHFVSGTFLNNNIAFLTNKPDVWVFLGPDLIKEAQTSGEWQKGVDAAGYYGNFYVLSPDKKAVYKYTSSETSFSGGSEYSKGDALSQGKSIAIDGNVYILTGSEVLKFLSGEKKDFSLKDLPNPLSNPTKIFTTPTLEGIYILDNGNKRVLVFDTEGKFQKQYVSADFGDLKGIEANEETKTLYLLAGTKVFEIKL